MGKTVATPEAEWTFGDAGFAKIYGDRLARSSLLDTGVATRWVFVFMLSQADSEGRFRCATVSALARTAAVTIEEARKAIEELSAPDPESTTKAHEGRRILPIQGGWQLVNYTVYRDYRSDEQQKAAERKRRQREAAAARAAELSERDMSQDITGSHVQTLDVRRKTPDLRKTDLASDDAVSILAYWQERTSTKLRSPKAHAQILARIKSRLRDGCSLTDLKACVDFALADEFYVGKGYAKKPDVIWRSAERVQNLVDRWEASSPVRDDGPSDEELARVDAETDRLGGRSRPREEKPCR